MELENEDRLLYSGLLFCEIRSPKKFDEKLTNIEKHLTKGVDVNTQDANDLNNTPLHVAVKKDEFEIVEFLLKNGANPKSRNLHDDTPLDLAHRSQGIKRNEIIKILDKSESSNEKKLSNVRNVSVKINKNCKENKKETLTNESRSGTTGLSGQLYESKLIGLLLLKALHDPDIKEFFIGSNLSGFGAFDDIAFKYHLKDRDNPIIILIQTKHRDDPSKNKLTTDSLFTSNTDFSLDKYFESFIVIHDKIHESKHNVMHRNDVPTSDRHFIIYTTVMENLNKKKAVKHNDKATLILTSDPENIFMYDYDDKDLESFLAKYLAKTFATYINSNKFRDLLKNDIISEYHVYFNQNILDINLTKSDSDEYNASFSQKFIESTDESLIMMRRVFIKEMKIQNPNSMDSKAFKLPKYFGNKDVPLCDEEYINLWRILKDIIEQSEVTTFNNDLKGIVIKKHMIRKIVKRGDIKKIKHLVGNILILDNETGLFKFNFDVSLEPCKTLMEKLISGSICDLKQFRFNIELDKFPQLTLKTKGSSKKKLIQFFDKLQLYTNQACEEKVEQILKNEIINLYDKDNRNSLIPNNLNIIKAHAIYLAYHDKVQKWWKSKEKKLYLTKSCEFYEKAKNSISSFPLTHIYNYTYVSKINNFMIDFDKNAIEGMTKPISMNFSNAKVLNIVTNDVILTSLKLKHCLEDRHFIFIDLGDVITTREDDIKELLLEMSKATIDFIIFIISDQSYVSFIKPKLIDILHNNKIIIVSQLDFSERFECTKYIDEKNTLNDLKKELKQEIVKNSSVVLQGSQVSFDFVVGENMYDLLKGNLLHNLIKNHVIEIGKKLSIKTTDFYIERRICRCLVLKLAENQYCKEFNVVKENSNIDLNNTKDLLLINNDENVYNEICKTYWDLNVHWFKKVNNNVKWMKTRGSIKKIIKWVKKNTCKNNHICSLDVQSLNQLGDGVVILSAGAGMGKSTLLAHLISQSKSKNGCINCIIKFNLLDLTTEFSKWQIHSLNWLIFVLYKAFSINDSNFINSDLQNEDQINNITYVDIEKRIHINPKNGQLFEQAFFEFQVFLNLYNDNKISLIFDGFDEVCPDFKDEAIQLFNLVLSSRIKCIWIATRPLILKDLESAMNSFSYSLKGFSENEQIMYLEQFWGLNFGKPNHLSNKKLYITQFLDALSHKIKDTDKHFTSIPLQLRMIAEVLREHFEEYVLNPDTMLERHNLYNAFNLIFLYDNFIHKKINEIRFGEKKDITLFTNPDMIRIKERERILFIENHKKLAVYSLLFGKNKFYPYNNKLNKIDTKTAGILTEEDFQCVKDLIKGFHSGEENNGFIDNITRNKPIFVHLTYAEYFSCELITERLCQKQNLNNESFLKFLVDYMLISNETEGIRRFLDAKLENDSKLSAITSITINDALLNQRFYSKTALNTAIMEGKRNIALFLLNNINLFLNKENLDYFIAMLLKKMVYCTICGTYFYNALSEISEMIAMIVKVDSSKLEKIFFCEDYPNNNIFMLNLFNFASTATVPKNLIFIVDHTSPEVLVKLLLSLKKVNFASYKRPMLHIMAENKMNVNYLNSLLLKLNQKQCMRVLSAKDQCRRIPAHFAATYDNFEFFEMMSSLVNIKQLKMICTSKDKYGTIPLKCFGSVFLTIDKFKGICLKAGIGFAFKEEGGWHLYDMDKPECIW